MIYWIDDNESLGMDSTQSECSNILSDAPQVSALDLVYKNGKDDNVLRIILKFANEAKLQIK